MDDTTILAMPQVIYTGKDYAQYQPPQGRALQALSQFAQQQQIREERELQRAREDRNLLARAMELNPVYATSSELQGEIGKVMDSYMEAATMLTKETGGRDLTTQDLVKINQLRSQAMAQMGQLKAWDDTLNQSWQMVQQRPDLYDMPLFMENYEKLRKNKRMPEGGLLYKKVNDPVQLFEGYAETRRGKEIRDSVWNEELGQYDYTTRWENQDRLPEEALIAQFASMDDGQYHIQHSFDRMGQSERKPYLEEAGGNEDVAANLWFKRNATGVAYPSMEYSRGGRPRATSITTEGIHRKVMLYMMADIACSPRRSPSPL